MCKQCFYILILSQVWCTFSFQSFSLLKLGKKSCLSTSQHWGCDTFDRFSLQMEACSWAAAAQHSPSQERDCPSSSLPRLPPAQHSLQFNWCLFADRMIDWQARSGIRHTRRKEQTAQSIKTSFPVELRADSWEDVHAHTHAHTQTHTHTHTHTHSISNCLFSPNTFSFSFSFWTLMIQRRIFLAIISQDFSLNSKY